MLRIRSSSAQRGWKYFWLRVICIFMSSRVIVYGSAGTECSSPTSMPRFFRKDTVNESALVSWKTRP